MKISILIASSLALSSCVTAGHYHEDVNNLQNQLNTCQANTDKAKQDLSSCQTQVLTMSKDKGQLQSSVDDLNKALSEMKRRQEEEQSRIKEFQDLTKRFKSLTDSGTLSVRIIDGKMVVSLGSDVLFASGSARLSAKGRQAIKDVSLQLAAIPSKRYQIEGHTDNVPIATSTFASNWELAASRALTVVKSMIEDGMPANRVSAASYADTSPISKNDAETGRAANRRIAIVVVPDLSSLPGYDELQKISQ